MNANNIYVGNRYTPLFCGPWDDENAYESLSAVTYTDGNAYVSKKPVPAGTVPTNQDYWVLWGSGNAALDSVTQRLNTVENDVENLENSLSTTQKNLPWKVSSTLKGDGVTDNTLLFGALDPDTPIALTPGTYLITGNVTIPCAIQFIPGAVIKYNAATPGTNYVTVTFAKGFYVPDNTQIFDTYIIPKIGGNNATVNPKFSWFGGKENNPAQTNDNILTWLLSETFNCKDIIIEPGAYSFQNFSTGEYYNSESSLSKRIHGEGAEIVSNVTVASVYYKGIKFSGGVNDNGFVIYENCKFTGTGDNGITTGEETLFLNCEFFTHITSNTGSFTIDGGSIKVLDISHFPITINSETGKTVIKNANLDINAISNPFRFTGDFAIIFENLNITCDASNFTIQLSSFKNSFISNCNCPKATIICTTAINNNCKELTADYHFGNVINGKSEPKETTKYFTGYTISNDVADILKPGANTVNLNLIAHYSDGTTEDLGNPTEGNKGWIYIIGTAKRATYASITNTISIDESETSATCLLVFKPNNVGSLPNKVYGFCEMNIGVN